MFMMIKDNHEKTYSPDVIYWKYMDVTNKANQLWN